VERSDWSIAWPSITGSSTLSLVSLTVCVFTWVDRIIGAMGCGAYRCPPKLVAEEMKAALLDHEFRGWFRQVTFAVYSKAETGDVNFDVFSKVFSGISLNNS
jgi:hypothetical protein